MITINAWALQPKEIEPAKSRPQISEKNDAISSFGSTLAEALRKVDNLEKTADEKSKQFVSGELSNVHDLMVAGEKSKIALELTIEIRNKLLEAYKSIERMPV